MLIKVDIGYIGIQRFPTDEENKVKIKSAINLFIQRYPGISIENYLLKYIGVKSMNLTFTVSTSDSAEPNEMQTYFDNLLTQQGYSKLQYPGDALAIAASLIEITGKRYEKPWWKFWE